MFSAFPNRFKYRQNACFRDIVFNKNSLQLQIVSNSVRMQTKNERQNPCCVGSLLQYSMAKHLQKYKVADNDQDSRLCVIVSYTHYHTDNKTLTMISSCVTDVARLLMTILYPCSGLMTFSSDTSTG